MLYFCCFCYLINELLLIVLVYWIGEKGGCFIVDSTRKGKRFPDSMSKTIPIWTCILNRAIQRYRNMMHDNGGVQHMVRVKDDSFQFYGCL